MKACSLRLALAIGLLTTSLVACSSSAEDGEDTGQRSSALRCRTCGVDPGDPPPPVEPPHHPEQGPSVDCTTPHSKVINGLCYEIAIPPDCDPPPPGRICGGYTVVGRYYCPVAYPVQHCNAYGSCSCWTY
jgi:hypothetical protein